MKQVYIVRLAEPDAEYIGAFSSASLAKKAADKYTKKHSRNVYVFSLELDKYLIVE